MPNRPSRIRARSFPFRILCPCVVIAIGFATCGAAQKPQHKSSTPDFTRDVVPILAKNCASCHSSTTRKGGLVLESYNTLMKGGRHGEVVVPRNAAASRVVAMIEGKLDPRMPLYSDPLGRADIAVIRSWINAGAPGPAANAPSPTISTPVAPSIRPQVPAVSAVASVKFSPDGRILAVGGYQEVRLIDVASGNLIGRLQGHADSVRSVAFSPDGKKIAAAGGQPQREGEIRIWDVSSRQLLMTLTGHKDCIYSIAWSPDGKLIASGSYDKMVKLWDASTGKEAKNLQDHIDAVFAVAFSTDGKRLATASQDRTVKIWDIATGKRLYTLSDAADGLVSLAYSPSGDTLAAGGYDKTIYVWQLGQDDGHLVHSLIADEDSILSMAWSHDGKTLVTASSDGSIRFRDANLDLKGVVDRQSEWVDAIDASPNGALLAAGRYNGSVTLYDLKTYAASRNSEVFDAVEPTGDEKAQEAASR